MNTPRGLSADEAAVWARLAASVVPMAGKRRPETPTEAMSAPPAPSPPPGVKAVSRVKEFAARAPSPPPHQRGNPLPNPPPPGGGLISARSSDPLDSHWERRLRGGTLAPNFTLDLHEHSLDAAYQRLLGGLDIARETGARVVLVIAGRERPGPAADRSGQRGAIRAKLLDWLAASRHAPAIATIRKAHRRHGGEGALYVILKKPR